jgi:transposase
VLACVDGIENKAFAAKLPGTAQTVSKWRARFVTDRLDGLLYAPRPGTPGTNDDTRVDTVIVKALASVPAG